MLNPTNADKIIQIGNKRAAEIILLNPNFSDNCIENKNKKAIGKETKDITKLVSFGSN